MLYVCCSRRQGYVYVALGDKVMYVAVEGKAICLLL